MPFPFIADDFPGQPYRELGWIHSDGPAVHLFKQRTCPFTALHDMNFTLVKHRRAHSM